MRTIGATTRIKKDFKRVRRQGPKGFGDAFDALVAALANDVPLDAKYRDHPLPGVSKDCRDCHLGPDLVLVYRKSETPPTLTLVRLGSHSDLFRE